MSSQKKRGKRLLADIQVSAKQLVLLTSELTLLEEVHELARNIETAVEALKQELAGLKKAEFSAALASSQILAVLDELVDGDAISALEQRLFAVQTEMESSEVGRFFQQLLEKIERLYLPLLASIQQLTALPDQE